MTEQKHNSEELEKLGEAVRRRGDQARQASLEEPSRPQEELDPRAKSSGHKKKTADKWNQ
jgi:hypothetical protein